MIALAMRYWWAIVIALLVAALGAQTMRLNNTKAEFAQYRAEVAEQSRKAAALRLKESEDARTEEQRRLAERDANVQQAAAERATAVAAAARADAAAAGLREQVARLSGAIRQATRDPRPTAGGAPATDPGTALDLLTGLFAGTDELAGGLAKALDRSRTAGLACERAYDSLTAKAHIESAP